MGSLGAYSLGQPIGARRLHGWGPTVWGPTVSGYRFWIGGPTYQTGGLQNGGLQSGGLQSRATDFGSGGPLPCALTGNMEDVKLQRICESFRQHVFPVLRCLIPGSTFEATKRRDAKRTYKDFCLPFKKKKAGTSNIVYFSFKV